MKPIPRPLAHPGPALVLTSALALTLALALATFAMAAMAAMPAPALAAPAGGAPMPAGFANVSLGMTQAALLRARPAARQGGGFRDDNAGHPKMLFEPVQAPIAEQAIYLFEDAQPVLAAVVLTKRWPAAAGRAIPAFRGAALETWGMPDEAAHGRAESGAREVALLWRRGETVVATSYPAAASGAAHTTVRIGKRAMMTAAYTGRLAPMDKAAQEELMRELRRQRAGSAADARH